MLTTRKKDFRRKKRFNRKRMNDYFWGNPMFQEGHERGEKVSTIRRHTWGKKQRSAQRKKNQRVGRQSRRVRPDMAMGKTGEDKKKKSALSRLQPKGGGVLGHLTEKKQTKFKYKQIKKKHKHQTKKKETKKPLLGPWGTRDWQNQ